MLAVLRSIHRGCSERATLARLSCALAAWLCGLWGLALLRIDNGSPLAVAALVLAGALGIFTLAGSNGASAESPVVYDLAKLASTSGRRALVAIGLLATVALSLGADVAFVNSPREPFGLAGWLWLLSMGSLVTSNVLWSRVQSVRPTSSGAAPAWTKREAALVILLLGLALGLRIWDLRDVPFAIHPDEILTGKNALLSFPENGASVPFFVTVWDRIDLPAPWFWLVANSVRIGDHTLASLRLPAALFGAAAVVPLYFLVRAEWGRLAALSGAVVLAASAVALQYSRTTINNIVTPFFWSVCFLFLLRAIRTRRPMNWALAGLAAGLSEYGYYGTHLLPFVLGGFFVYLLLTRRQQGRHLLTGFGTLALGYLVGFGPLLAYFVRFRPDVYFGRGSAEGVLMWNHVPRDLADAQLMWSTLSPLVVENLLGFNTHGGQDSFYWAPLLPASETALLVIGVALLIWQWRRPAAFLMLLSGFGVLFVGGTLIHGVPYFAHWTPAFPAIYAAIAVVVGTWASQWRGIRAKWRRLGPAAVMVGLSVNIVSNVDFYFNRYVVPRPEFELRAAQSRWEADLGTAYQVYTAGKTWQPYDAEVNGYLIHGQQGAALDQPERQLPLLDAPGKGLGFVFLPDNEPYQGLVATVYPGGTWGEVRSHTGSHLFNTYVIALAGQPAEVTTGQSAGAAPHLTLSSTGREVTLRPPTLVKPAAILGAGAGLNGPRALAVSSTGDLLVADTGNQRVVRLDARGTVIADVPGAFELPAAVGITSNDQLLTVDGHTGMLQRFSPEGRLVLSARLGTSNANGLAVDRAGRFWVADTTNNRVARYSPDGQLEAELRGGAQPPDRFEQPIAVALGPDGTLFVADLRGRIVELDDQGLVRREWPVQIGTGRGVSQLLVWRGQLLLTDPERHRLELLDPNTGELRTIGEPGREPGQFRRPLGLATDAADRLYVVDSDNARIQVFTTLDQP